MRQALALVLLAAASAQTALHLDPVHGVDQPGRGSAAAPLKTMTFAVTQAAGPALFLLRPGQYETASGEVFPINLPPTCFVTGDPATVPSRSGLVGFATTLGLTSTLLAAPSTAANVTVREMNFSGGMFRAIRLDAPAGVASTLTVERCSIGQSRCVVVNAAAQSQVTVRLFECQCSGPDTPIILSAAAGSTIDATFDACSIVGGLSAGIHLDATQGGSIHLTLRACRIGGGPARGLHALTDHGGAITTRIEHCLIHQVGQRAIGTTVGAIVDNPGSTGLAPQHAIVNSILHRNRADAPGGTSAAYTWGANFVSQANLAGIGGNSVSTATFVDETGNDFHLAPTSAGRDGGRPSDRTVQGDIDGDWYLDALPDLGPDEVHFAYVEGPAVATLGATFTMRPLVAPQSPYLLLLATGRVPVAFGSGMLHLAGSIVDVGLTGTCDANGVGRVTLTVPANPWLHRRSLFWQGVTVTPPFLGANALATVLRQ